MAGENGIWLLYRKTQGEKGETHRLMGRFAIYGGNIAILEDHDSVLEGIFSSGPMTDKELRRMKALENGMSPYWELVREDDINEGKRMELVPELELGGESWPQEGE